MNSQSSPRSEKMTDSKEAMVRWLKVQDAPFGSFHGENFFHGASGSSGSGQYLYTTKYSVITQLSSLQPHSFGAGDHWWCLGGVRPKSPAKRKEDEDTSRHFSGGIE